MQMRPIHPIEENRARLAAATAQFLAAGGSIQEIAQGCSGGGSIRGRRDIVLSYDDDEAAAHRDTALIGPLRELVAQGFGITELSRQLNTPRARVRRIAARNGIEIPERQAATPLADANKARRAQQKLSRMRLADILRPLAAQGFTIARMADATGACKRTVMNVIEEFSIPRGRPRKDQ